MRILYTNQGLILKAKMEAGLRLQLTKIEAGDIYSNAPQSLQSVLNARQVLSLEAIETNGAEAILKITLSNLDVKEEYYMRQMGIYALDPEANAEILYIIRQDEQGERIPAVSDMQVEYNYQIRIKTENGSSISFNSNGDSYVKKAFFSDQLVSFEDYESDMGLPEESAALAEIHSGSKVGNLLRFVKALLKIFSKRMGSSSIKAIGDGTITGAIKKLKESLDEFYKQATDYADGKISDLINGAPETLDTLKEVADAISNNKTVIDSLNAAIGKKLNTTEFTSHEGNTTIHVTSSERSIWNAKQGNVVLETDTASSMAPGSGGTFSVIDSLKKDSNGHVLSVNKKNILLPAIQTLDTKFKMVISSAYRIANGEAYVTIGYPQGFNNTNCAVISSMYMITPMETIDPDDTEVWQTGTAPESYPVPMPTMHVSIIRSGIRCILQQNPMEGGWIRARIILMKITD